MAGRKHTFVIIIALISIMLLYITPVFAAGSNIEKTNEKLKEFKIFMDKYSNIILAFGLVTSVLIFIIHFIRLASTYNHPIARQEVIRDIGVTGLIIALMGGIGLVSKLVVTTFL